MEPVAVDDALQLLGGAACGLRARLPADEVVDRAGDVERHLADADRGTKAHGLGRVDQVRGQAALAVSAHGVAHGLADRALKVLQGVEVIDRGGRECGVGDLAVQHRRLFGHVDQVNRPGALFDAQLLEVALDHTQRHTGGLRHAQALGGDIGIVAQCSLDHGAGAVLLQRLLLLRQGHVRVVLLFGGLGGALLRQAQVIRHLAGPFCLPARYISTMACSVGAWPVACSAWTIWRRSRAGTEDTRTFLPLTRT